MVNNPGELSGFSQRCSGRRIAVLVPSLTGGGVERNALNIAAGLIERGHDVDLLLQCLVCHYPSEVPGGARVFYISSRVDERTKANFERVPISPRPLAPNPQPWRIRFPRIGLATKLCRNQLPLLMSTRLPRWAAGVAEYLNRERPDAILSMNILSTTAAAMALCLVRQRPARIVATLNQLLNSKRSLYRAKRAYPYADTVVGVSHGVCTEFSKISGLEQVQVHTIYNPVVSTYLIQRARESVDHPWLCKPDSRVILAIGRLHKDKDFPILLAAFARLLTLRPARLIILGKGRMQRSLLSLAKNLRISEYMDLPGFVENPYAFLSRADLFVLSSRNESFSSVLVQAMACGCPVVSTDCDFGPREILEGGKHGELVPVGDPEALSAAMARALDKPLPRDALRERASFFNAETAVGQYEKLLLGKSGGTAS